MKDVLILRKTLGDYSAGTRFTLQNTDEKIGTATLETAYPVKQTTTANTGSHSHKRRQLTLTFEELDDLFNVVRKATYIVPTMNSRERRRRVKAAMRAIIPHTN